MYVFKSKTGELEFYNTSQWDICYIRSMQGATGAKKRKPPPLGGKRRVHNFTDDVTCEFC